jgi:hypothetical protein
VRERARHEVRLVARGAGDHEIAVADPGSRELASAHGAGGDRGDVVALGQRLEARGLEIDDRDVVIGMQRLDHLRADEARPDHENAHPAPA